MAVEHAMFKFEDLKVNSRDDRQYKVRNIEQKGVAQLLQILRRCSSNLPEGVVLVNHHMHKKLAFF